jgi:hypothetical protein
MDFRHEMERVSTVIASRPIFPLRILQLLLFHVFRDSPPIFISDIVMNATLVFRDDDLGNLRSSYHTIFVTSVRNLVANTKFRLYSSHQLCCYASFKSIY